MEMDYGDQKLMDLELLLYFVTMCKQVVITVLAVIIALEKKIPTVVSSNN